MRQVNTIAEVRKTVDRVRLSGARIAFVPTMGALHAGHLQLVKDAAARADFVVVSIFVNPSQFDRTDDLASYPRDLQGDLAALRAMGAHAPHLVFTPDESQLYPRPLVTTVSLPELTQRLCGASRPGHFDGVATVVCKLLAIMQPDVAVFGRKDRQQLAIIERMVADLNLAVQIVGVPTVRDEDGVAFSSRNALLSPTQRLAARTLPRALLAGLDVATQARQDGDHLDLDAINARIRDELAGQVDYVELVDPDTMLPPLRPVSADSRVVLAAAVHFDQVRLIDNVEFGDPADEQALRAAIVGSRGAHDPDNPHDRGDAQVPDAPQRAGDLSAASLAAAFRRTVKVALAEDLGDAGDLTTQATMTDDLWGRADLVARAHGVVAGLEAVAETYRQLDDRVTVTLHAHNGQRVTAATKIASLEGPLAAILSGERTALNLVGHLSGIATLVRQYVDQIADTDCRLRDTRKTTPGLRILEKAAVSAGGGVNHRIGLFDAILIKDNHVAAAGSVTAAVQAAARATESGVQQVALTERAGHETPGMLTRVPQFIQVEVDTLEQFDEAVEAGAMQLLLDNFTPDEVALAVQRSRELRDRRGLSLVLEASGGIDDTTVRSFALAGVDFVSVGAVTHSAPQFDVALDIVATGRSGATPATGEAT